jgi:hypothetical protein
MSAARPGSKRRRVADFLRAWRSSAAHGFSNTFGPGLLGGFTPLRRTLRVGALAGAGTGLLGVILAGRPWILVPGLIMLAPLAAVLLLAAAVLVLTGADTLRTTWLANPERRLKRLTRSVDNLEKHLEELPLSVSTIPERGALISELRSRILHEVFRTQSSDVWWLEKRVAALADAEHEQATLHSYGRSAAVEARRILAIPESPHRIRVFERRGAARANPVHALALTVLLREYALGGKSSLKILVEAPETFAAYLELDGWLPHGDPVEPATDEERETMKTLWDDGSSTVYTDAAALLEAARLL